MNFFNCLIINVICIVFPLLTYIIYLALCHDIKKEEENLILEVTLISSLYLIIKYGHFEGQGIYQLIFVHIPTIVAFSKRKNKFAFLLSLTTALFLLDSYKVCALSSLITSIIYVAIFSIKDNIRHNSDYFLNIFSIIKVFSFTLCIYYMYDSLDFIMIINIFISTILLYIFAKIVLFILKNSEEILDLNVILKELEKEKILKTSLFQITHEIKNPIAVCKGYLDMMEKVSCKKKDQYIPIIKSEINRTLMIMDDFLDFTKIKVNLEVMDINMLLEELVSELNPLFNMNEVKTNFSISKDEVYIMGDYNRLKQVFINIFKNSIEAKNDKQLIITLDEKIIDNSIQINVVDNGIGMDKKTLNRCGEMFYTTKKNGTGLGVGLSKEIINLHRGKIKYTSSLGNGTTIMIKLPIICE